MASLPKSRLEWKVGLFVFLGLALLAVLLIEFSKGMSFFGPTYTIHLVSTDVGGLKPRAQVLMSGVEVGKVSDIRLARDGKTVTIDLQVYSAYQIHKDARFAIEQSGFLGDNYVAIVPTENAREVFKNDDQATADPPFNIIAFIGSSTDLIKRLDEAIGKLDRLFTDLNQRLITPETLTNLAVTVANVRQLSTKAHTTLSRLDLILETNSPNVSLAVSNLATFSDNLNLTVAQVTNLLAANRPALQRSLQNIESSSQSLKALLADLEAGKGSAGKLLKDEQLAANLALVSGNLAVTSSNLNRLGLWGILWKHDPPKTNQVQPPRLGSPKTTH